MIVLATAMAIPIAYLLIGWRIAVKDMPRAWEATWQEHPDKPDDSDWYRRLQAKYRQRDVRENTWTLILWWLYVTPYRRLQGAVDRAAAAQDPREAARRIAEQADYIHKLEAELGIKNTP